MGFIFKNTETGDTIEAPPPNMFGKSIIRFNGRVVEHVTYSDDETGGSVALDSGRTFDSGKEFGIWLAEQLRVGAWKVVN